MDAAGKILKRQRVASSPEHFRHSLAEFSEPMKPSKDVRAVKRALRQRLFLVQLRTMVKNRIRALLTQHSVEVPKISDLFGKAGLAWLQQVELPGPDSSILREDLQLLKVFAEKSASTERLIEQLAQGDGRRRRRAWSGNRR